MPLYEYECRACHHRFEALVRDSNVPACPACSAENPERLLSLFGVSSENTRQSSLSKARKAQAKVHRDKAIAEHEEAHHAHEH
jgi:putative FmdB family regulatory protein